MCCTSTYGRGKESQQRHHSVDYYGRSGRIGDLLVQEVVFRRWGGPSGRSTPEEWALSFPRIQCSSFSFAPAGAFLFCAGTHGFTAGNHSADIGVYGLEVGPARTKSISRGFV